MNQLDDGTKTDRTVAHVPRIASRKQQQRWAQALPAPGEQIPGNFRDRFNGRPVLIREFVFDLHQVVANQIKYFLCRQK